jgi:hypothetical protein
LAPSTGTSCRLEPSWPERIFGVFAPKMVEFTPRPVVCGQDRGPICVCRLRIDVEREAHAAALAARLAEGRTTATRRDLLPLGRHGWLARRLRGQPRLDVRVEAEEIQRIVFSLEGDESRERLGTVRGNVHFGQR